MRCRPGVPCFSIKLIQRLAANVGKFGFLRLESFVGVFNHEGGTITLQSMSSKSE
jgi:hypothetical protein